MRGPMRCHDHAGPLRHGRVLLLLQENRRGGSTDEWLLRCNDDLSRDEHFTARRLVDGLADQLRYGLGAASKQ